jgi:hypothetical protein
MKDAMSVKDLHGNGEPRRTGSNPIDLVAGSTEVINTS